MNLLFIITTAFVVHGRTSNALDTEFKLLKPPTYIDLVEESYTLGRLSYNFISGLPVPVDPSDTGLVGLNLTAPFMVTAIFKSNNGKSSCLFSITQDDRVAMSLCIQAAGYNVSMITLRTELYSPENSIYGLINENFKEKWFKIVVYVKDDKAEIYVNCVKLQDTIILSKDTDVLLTKDMQLNLAFSISKRTKFEGLIEEINLYTDADEDTLRYACNKLTNFESSALFNKNPNEISPQPLEYDYKKDLADCRREITGIKEGMHEQIENIKDSMNEQMENVTMLIRNEIREDIEQLISTNAYLVQELQIIQRKIERLEDKQKSVIPKQEIPALESQQKLLQNPGSNRRKRNASGFE